MIGAIVLAAGGSRRLGRPKQLLVHDGRTLVRRTAELALEVGYRPVCVVLGARAADIAAELDGLEVDTVVNDAWSEGIGSSIRAGMRVLERSRPGPRAVLLLPCDLPLLQTDVLARIRRAYDGTPGRRIACEYAGTVGTPALFDRALFPDLRSRSGHRGARELLERNRDRLLTISWPEGAHDVDREEDLGPGPGNRRAE